MRNLFALVSLGISLYSCKPTELMRLSVQEPAPVTLPGYIKNIGVINRSIPEKNKAVDIIDKIFTLEGVDLDKEGSEAGISGLTTALMQDPRFTDVKTIDHTTAGSNNPSPQSFQSPMNWEAVDQICRQHNIDALFVLELFDTDSKISYDAVPVKLKTPVGEVPAVEQQATMITMVKTGWRVYDPAARVLLDEYAVARSLTYTGRGINPVAAAGALIGRKDAVKEAGAATGQRYASRITPFWLRVSRDYYTRGSDNFKTAKRKAQTGNWDGAAELWHQETSNSDRKIAGRACYNMAIISEINGELDKALSWARQSYENYENRLALNYVRILENRKINDNILKSQQAEHDPGNYDDEAKLTP